MAETKLAVKNMRKGLAVSLAFSIERALNLIAVGKVEAARVELEDTLCYVTAIDAGAMEHVGLDAVRPGKGF